MSEVITCANCITALGHDGPTCAASYFSGITRISYDRNVADAFGNPIKSARIEGLFEDVNDETQFINHIAAKCLGDLCRDYFEQTDHVDDVFIFFCLPSKKRPGPDFNPNGQMVHQLETILAAYASSVVSETIESGNAATIKGILRSRDILSENPHALCIVGGVDSLLSKDTLEWFEQDYRLKSDSNDKNHSFVPSHAAGFFIIESDMAATIRKQSKRFPLKGIGFAMEPAPFVSTAPSQAKGLTQAVRTALKSQASVSTIGAVYCDMNGEYHRAREWGMVDLRCFDQGDPAKELCHPSDCMGSIGAASLPVYINLAVESFAKEPSHNHICFCLSDDHGERGALILEKAQTS